MENKTLFEVDTAWSFPVMTYTTNTSYVEVKQASGIAYILLQLISNTKNNSDKLTATLNSLGVPNDIHYIFASELANMINYGIIEMKQGLVYDADLINYYDVSNFNITDLGKKMFAEGAIPTGNNSNKSVQVFYDVAIKDARIKFDGKLCRIENSPLDESCIGNTVLNNADVENFINENMSKYSFRKGERITGYDHEEPEIYVYKLDDAVTVKITSEGLFIQAKDKERNEYIHKNYSAKAIMKILELKKKYKFPENIANRVKEYDFETIKNIEKIIMPSQFVAATSVKSPLAISDCCNVTGCDCLLDKNESQRIMQKCDVPGVVCYFDNGCAFSVIVGRFLIGIDGYTEKGGINLIIVQKLDENVKNQLLKEIFLGCIEHTTPLSRCNVIKQLTKVSGSGEYIEKFAQSILISKNSLTEKIETFINLNESFNKVDFWNEYAKTNANIMLDELSNQVSVDSFMAQNMLGKKLNQILRMNDLDYLNIISKKIIEDEGTVVAYEAMESAGFSADIALSVVNVFEQYCNEILNGLHVSGNSKLSSQCTLLGQSLLELREITGIENPNEDSAELDFDNDRFIQVMVTFSDSMKKLEKYKMYAINEFKDLIAFKDRFMDLKEVVTIEQEALKNPKNINAAYIEQRLKKSRYKDAICDLHVRLQYELNRIFNCENVPTYDLLSKIELLEYLSVEEVDALHILRKCRNGFQHPMEKRSVHYSEEIIRNWCGIVERLGGIEHESRS